MSKFLVFVLAAFVVACGTDSIKSGANDVGLDTDLGTSDSSDFGTDTSGDTEPDTDSDTGSDTGEDLSPSEDCVSFQAGTLRAGLWGNLQFPAVVSAMAGAQTEFIFGQLYSEGETEASGAAGAWRAEVLWGPYLTDSESGCWRASPAEFNVQAGNNDEFKAALTVPEPGVYGLLYRYTHTNGQVVLGGPDGPADGVPPVQGLLKVYGDMPVEAVATQNLKCREDWAVRKARMVDVFAQEKVRIIGLQEDCLGTTSQAEELAAALAEKTGIGFQVWRETTHEATNGGQTWAEGIAIISAIPFEIEDLIDLPHANFPRKALVARMIGNTTVPFFTATHLDYGANGEDARNQSAEALGDKPGVVVGDFNAVPTSAAILTMAASFSDVWNAVHPGQNGFTFPADAPTRRIDYIFVKDGLVSPKNITLVGQAGTLSDHLGVVATY